MAKALLIVGLVLFVLCLLGLAALVLLRRRSDDGAGEFAADFDALADERNRLDGIKRKAAEADRAQVAAIAAVRNGPGQHDGQEL